MKYSHAELDRFLGKGAVVEVTPDKVVSREWRTITFKITLGAGGLKTDDRLGMVCGSNIDRWQFQFASHIWGGYTPWQVHDPAAPNFLSVSHDHDKTPLQVRVGSSGGLKTFVNRSDHLVRAWRQRFRYLLEIGCAEDLPAGDTLTIAWGNREWGSPGVRAPCLALNYFFPVFKFSALPRDDRDLPQRRGTYEALPAVRVTGGPATRLHCTAQPLLQRGQAFRLHCAAIDDYGNLDENFTGEIQLLHDDPAAQVPQHIRLTSRHGGHRTVTGLSLDRPGWHSLSLRRGDLTSSPLPLLVTEEAPATRIFFGEMHGHTLDCDGTFPADDHFHYARRVAGLDFASLASHIEYFGCAEAFQRYLDSATRARTPGRFETFYGYEWAAEGHTNAYFLDPNDVFCVYGKRILRGRHPQDDPPFRTPCNREGAFFAKLKRLQQPVLAIAHYHSAYSDSVDDEILRLHEVYSMHQQNPREARLQEVLARGLHVGVVAGSDSHRLPLGSLCPDPDKLWNQPLEIDGETGSQSIQKKCGIQAVLAPRLSRPALFDAMRRRQTYGTTGARMVILFEIGGQGMGRRLACPAGGALRLTARIGCSAPIREVVVMHYNGKTWRALLRKKELGTWHLDLDQPLPGAKGQGIYYLHVTQQDGEQGWSSPIWVE